MNTLKSKVLAYYKQQVGDRIDAFRDMIAALTEDASNDAKGSAGDKHETALSMMHLEQEKLNHKLKEFLNQKAVLERINIETSSNRVVLGSLVKANDMHLFVSAALQKITVDGTTIIALSPHSPLGMKMMGLQVGDAFEAGTTAYTINELY